MRFVATFQTPPNGDVPPYTRLKTALKRCLRGAGFRCVDVREVPQNAPAGRKTPAAGIVVEGVEAA